MNDDNFLYGFVTTGFKPGGLNISTSNSFQLPAFPAETVLDYELGWKSTMLDGHLRTQLDGYYDDFKNFQVIVGSTNYLSLPSYELGVAQPSRMYGVEFEAQAVFGALSFEAGLGLEHSSLGTFYSADPRVANTSVCNPFTGPGGGTCLNLTGHPMSYAPNFSNNFSVQYQFDLEDGDTLTSRANYSHEDAQWATLFDNPKLGDRLGARDLLGAQLAWKHDDYVVTLYGTNLTDEHYVAALNTNLDFAGVPRQFGVRLMKAW